MEAVLKFDEQTSGTSQTLILNELNMLKNQIGYIVSTLEVQNEFPAILIQDNSNRKITTEFITSITKAFQPGIKV